MQDRIVEVVTPTRLHFGLLSLGHGGGRQYGGVGAMIEAPRLHLRICDAQGFVAEGRLANRAREFATRWFDYYARGGPNACRIQVLQAPQQHVGLGVGTQLGLSVAAGLHALFAESCPDAAQLAASVGRALRSAVGTYGFARGGLISERGKLPGEQLAPLHRRVELPQRWRFVLIRPAGGQGLSGQAERQALEGLPAVPLETTRQLTRLLMHHMLPAAEHGSFDAFSDAVFRFGRLAGSSFADVQGGPYNGPHLQELVALIRSWGISGVGQSSWGPTLFAIAADRRQAASLVAELKQYYGEKRLYCCVTAPNNCGARIRVRYGGAASCLEELES